MQLVLIAAGHLELLVPFLQSALGFATELSPEG